MTANRVPWLLALTRIDWSFKGIQNPEVQYLNMQEFCGNSASKDTQKVTQVRKEDLVGSSRSGKYLA